jgi:hypothetical protein
MERAGGYTFDVTVCRLQFTARGALHFAAGKPANVARGVLGSALHATPAYARVFAPRDASGPSGLSDVPRPFVLRAAHLDGRTIEAGEAFHIDAHLFDTRDAFMEEIGAAFSAWHRAALTGVMVSRVSVALDGPSDPIDKLRIRFLTPTELKSGARIAERPEFPILLARARDRVSTLRAAYGPGPLEMDFAGLAERAGRVRMTLCETRHTSVERHSKGTGQRHPMGGFTGHAEYEGALGEFLPILRAAEWTGVGRQTVWGNGALSVEV